MERKTNLRALRLQYDIPLSELSAASGLSNQYISRAELGEISPTPRLEEKLKDAVETVIAQRHERIGALERTSWPARAVCSRGRRVSRMNETYYIPTNFTDAGRVMGLFEIRNMVESVLLTLPTLYLCVVLLPLALTPKIMVTLTIIVPIGGFGLIGISDDSLTRWLGCWWHWRKNRRIIFFGGECKN